MSGLEEIMTESGIIGSGTASTSAVVFEKYGSVIINRFTMIYSLSHHLALFSLACTVIVIQKLTGIMMPRKEHQNIVIEMALYMLCHFVMTKKMYLVAMLFYCKLI